MHLIATLLTSSSPVVYMLFGLALLGGSRYARKWNSREAAKEEPSGGVMLQLESRKLVSIEKGRSRNTVPAVSVMRRVSNG